MWRNNHKAKRNRLRWLGHVKGMNPEELHVHGSNRKKYKKPRRTWWDCVQAHIVQYEIRDCEKIVKNRTLWRQTVEAIGL